MSAEQAQTEIMSQEFASQIASLTQRLSAERVRAIQLEQRLEEVTIEVQSLRQGSKTVEDQHVIAEDHSTE